MPRTPKTDAKRSVPRCPTERTRNTHKAMIARCTRPSSSSFKYYGARGITVCERWRGRGGFDRFVEDVGLRPADCTLDRFPDADGNYEPGNVRWATPLEQSRRRSTVDLVEHNGRFLPLASHAELAGISHRTVHDRVHRFGWSIADALTTPPTVSGWGGNRAVERAAGAAS